MSEPWDYLRVGVYMGWFAPINDEQIGVAKAFMEQMKLDYLFVIPYYMDNSSPWHDGISRLRMCELAFEGTDGVVISDTAVRGGEDISILDILRELKRPDTRLFALFPTDEVLNFSLMENFEEVLSLCYPTYYRSENDPIMTDRIVACISDYYKKYGVMFRKIVKEPRNILTSKIRRAAASGSSLDGMVPAAVEKFIVEHRLWEE